jgi:hypothetical protein
MLRIDIGRLFETQREIRMDYFLLWSKSLWILYFSVDSSTLFTGMIRQEREQQQQQRSHTASNPQHSEWKYEGGREDDYVLRLKSIIIDSLSKHH